MSLSSKEILYMNMQYVLNPYAAPRPPWATWNDGFSPAELDILQNYAINADIPANVGGNNNGRVDNDIRRSKVKWMNNDNEYSWVFHRLGHIISTLNAQFYQFDLTGFGEALQLTNYSENDHGMYGWHQDGGGGMNMGPCRKLSLVMQLADPSRYEGGNLQIMTGGEPQTVEKRRGLISVFPSWTLHQVTPVTQGSRQSLVLWVTGPQFK